MTKVPAGASVPLPTRRSAWSTRDKVVRVLWGTIGRLLWIVVPASRSQVLRWFGARVGRGCRFARRVEVTIPWKLRVGDDVEVGEGVILYSLGEIAIGSGRREHNLYR